MLEEGESKGWDAYFEEVFEQVTRGKMDEMKDAYQGVFSLSGESTSSRSLLTPTSPPLIFSASGTEEEKTDLYAAYELHDGSLPDMMTEVVFSSSSDEPRFIALINAALAAGTLESTDLWTKTSTDTKAIKKRAAAEKREAREAEEHAKALGVWDEFYGSGKATDKKVRKSKLKGKAVDAEDDEGDLEGLKALMLRRKQGGEQRFESLIAGLEAKAKAPPSGAKGKKGKKADENAAPADVRPFSIHYSRSTADPTSLLRCPLRSTTRPSRSSSRRWQSERPSPRGSRRRRLRPRSVLQRRAQGARARSDEEVSRARPR